MHPDFCGGMAGSQKLDHFRLRLFSLKLVNFEGRVGRRSGRQRQQLFRILAHRLTHALSAAAAAAAAVKPVSGLVPMFLVFFASASNPWKHQPRPQLSCNGFDKE